MLEMESREDESTLVLSKYGKGTDQITKDRLDLASHGRKPVGLDPSCF